MAVGDIKNSIIKYISGFDSAGKSNSKIDTLLEYNKLGEYLNGTNIQAEVQYSELSDNDKNTLQKLYAKLKDKFSNFVSDKETMPIITAENAKNYTDLWRHLDCKANKDEIEELTYKKLAQTLYQFAIENGYPLDSPAEECDFGFITKEVLDIIQTKEDRKILADKTLKNINKPYNNSKLIKEVKNYIKENKISSLTEQNDGVDLGNGKFDKSATQKTEVCWALASINSLLTSEKGKELLESNRYYDKNTGIFAIHLQEAEDCGLHDGIYIITPDDIRAEGNNLAEGEGDATAYLIAIKRYFAEVKQNPEIAEKLDTKNHPVRDLDTGNTGFRFFEIITGGKFSKYNYKDIDRPIQNGIGTGDPNATGGFEEIYNLINNKSGAATMVIGAHSISVVGAKDGKLIIQESNNNEIFAEEYSDKQRNHTLFNRIEDINGAPAYELSQDDYEHYIRAVSFLKW